MNMKGVSLCCFFIRKRRNKRESNDTVSSFAHLPLAAADRARRRRSREPIMHCHRASDPPRSQTRHPPLGRRRLQDWIGSAHGTGARVRPMLLRLPPRHVHGFRRKNCGPRAPPPRAPGLKNPYDSDFQISRNQTVNQLY
jgi:hypothetical protein